jgi:hypothetical protein
MRPASFIAAIFLTALASPARAAESSLPAARDVSKGLSKWPVNLEDPVSSVPTPTQRDENPLEYGYHIMDLAALGAAANKRGDYPAAARFYEATVKADPETAVGYRMACDANDKSGNEQRARSLCRGALGVQGVRLSDYLRYSELVFRQTGELSAQQREDLVDIVKHLNADPKTVGAAAEVECELATRIGDSAGLEHCTKVLEKAAPNDAKGLSFRWAQAMRAGDLDHAQRLLVAAQKTPIRPEALATMQRAMQAEMRPLNRLRRNWLLLVMASLGLAGLGFVAISGKTRRRRLQANTQGGA